MASVTVEITGMAEIQANLYRKLQELQMQAQAAIENATDFTYNQSKADCPYDYNKPAGEPHLRDSAKKEIGVLEGSVSYGNDEVDWQWYIELGTRKMHARPFLGPNFERGSMQLDRELKAMTV